MLSLGRYSIFVRLLACLGAGILIGALLSFYNRWSFFQRDVKHYGMVEIHSTDIGDQCGADLQKKDAWVWYKITDKDKVIYMCPKSWWPYHKRVVAKSFPGTPITAAYKDTKGTITNFIVGKNSSLHKQNITINQDKH